MLSKVIIFLFIGAVSANTLSKLLLERHRPNTDDSGLHTARRIPWDHNIDFRAENFPCPEKGFFRHPTNCSRFYRCINYNDKSTEFSIFQYECQIGGKFVPGIDVCIPGACSDRQSEISYFDKIDTDVGGSSGSGPDEANSQPEQIDGQQEAVAADMADTVGAAETAGDADSGGAAETASAAETAGPMENAGAAGDASFDVSERCMGIYEAHSMYCNRYHLCGDPSNVFQCGLGTVFSELNQMCRLKQFNEDLCEGKELHPEPVFKVVSPFNFLQGMPPVKNFIPYQVEVPYIPQNRKYYHDRNNVVANHIFPALHLFNPSSDSKHSQDILYGHQDGIGSHKFTLNQEINKPHTEQLFAADFSPNNEPFSAVFSPNNQPFSGLFLPNIKPFSSALSPYMKPFSGALSPNMKPFSGALSPNMKPFSGALSPNMKPFVGLYNPNYPQSAPFIQNNVPRYPAVHSEYQPTYNIPLKVYSIPPRNVYPNNAFVNPYNNFYTSFYEKNQSDDLDDSSENEEDSMQE